jgi:hypothetical protein
MIRAGNWVRPPSVYTAVGGLSLACDESFARKGEITRVFTCGYLGVEVSAGESQR